MKKLIALFLIALACLTFVFASEFATSKSGKLVFLRDDGSWYEYGFDTNMKTPYVGSWGFSSDYTTKLVNRLLEESDITPDSEEYSAYKEALLNSPKVVAPDVSVEITKRACLIKMYGDILKMDYVVDEKTGVLTCINDAGGRIQFGVFNEDYTKLSISGDSRLTMDRVK